MFGWTTKIGRLVESMAADRSGATSIEYALIAIIVGVGIILSLQGVTSELNPVFNKVDTELAANNT